MAKRKGLSQIGRYSVIKVLGRGGMGTVYLCHDPSLDRPVAVKVLKGSHRPQKRSSRKMRFLREALATARLQHHGIPPVYEVRETDEGMIYYVMKPIEGRSLQEILDNLRDSHPGDREEYDLYRLVEILRDVCQTILYAHDHGYVHRDLKPSNIFVGDFGEVYVIDWGLTKILTDTDDKSEAATRQQRPPMTEREISDDTETIHLAVSADSAAESTVSAGGDITLAGDILGTLAYMPPEQADGRNAEMGKNVDTYALGVILYEMLTLELPIEGDTFEEVLKLKQEGSHLAPEETAPHREIPLELSIATLRAMHPEIRERFQTVKAFINALEIWLEGKTAFRNVFKSSFEQADFDILPRNTRTGWRIEKDSITTCDLPEGKPSWLLYRRDCPGDIKFTINVLADPGPRGEVSEFGVIINASYPTPWKNFVDGYSIRFAAAGNTRAFISKDDTEVISNEYVVLEPGKRYRIVVERRGSDLRVMLNRQIILYHRDRGTVAGLQVGFMHFGSGVTYSGVKVQVKGFPTQVRTLDVPEALMAEGCHNAALRYFLSYSQDHKNRREGAFARYRASLAAFRLDGNRKRALKILQPLKKGPFVVFSYLGKARIEIEKNKMLKAARILQEMLDKEESLLHLEPVADVAFGAVQLLMRSGSKQGGWLAIDAWSRLCLILGQRVESYRTMTPSILWRWILLALTRYPKHLEDCIIFLRHTFGKGRGTFAEVLTCIDPLLSILRRSISMQDHDFLVDRIMRLVLHHDDNLGNLETLARFYLHAGHERDAWKISRHILNLCQQHDYKVPPMPVTLVAMLEWLKGEPDHACELFECMVEKSDEWAKADGLLLLGLEAYRLGQDKTAHSYWGRARTDSNAIYFNRHMVAEGLLGLLPPDPVEAKVPQRSDHRLLYCLFLGYRYWIDWKRTGREKDRILASDLLGIVIDLLRPSYDIYSATDTFARVPLEEMGVHLVSPLTPEPLSPDEKKWIKQLTLAAAEEMPGMGRKTTSTHRKAGSRKKKPEVLDKTESLPAGRKKPKKL